MDADSSERYVPDAIPEEDLAYFEESRYGNRVGWGDSPAVLVVDMTRAFLEGRRTDGDPVAPTAELLVTARSAGVPVVYAAPDAETTYPDGYPVPTKASPASHRGPDPDRDRDERAAWREKLTEFPEPVEPRRAETVVAKPRASAFFDTHLANLLHHEGVDTLVVAGTNTGGCVRATVVDSHSSNFRTVVPPECVAGTSTVVHEVTLFDLEMRYADVTPLDDVLDRIAATD